jgi:DNA-binding MarR family transcriptional regulator
MAHTAVVRALDRELADRHGLPLAWYDVLVQLHESGGATTMGELAELLLIAPSNCTRIVERMQAAGLVDRRVDSADLRVRRVALTVAGGAALRAAAVTHLAGIERHFGAHLSDDQAAGMAAVFAAVQRSATNGPSGEP